MAGLLGARPSVISTRAVQGRAELMTQWHPMTDEQALELLQLLHLYVKTYQPDIPQTVAMLAEDLAVDNVPEAGVLAADIVRVAPEWPEELAPAHLRQSLASSAH